jgi:preprotein translocase subunit YajC
MASLIPIVILFVLMYLLLIRPQQQRVRRQRELISSLQVGDRIVTVGGLLGTIRSLHDETAEVEVADGIVLTFIRPAISRRADVSTGAAASTDDVLDAAPDADSPGAPEVEA